MAHRIIDVHCIFSFGIQGFFFFFFLFLKLQQEGSLVAACGVSFPSQGSNPGPPALGVQSVSHWTTGEV